MLFCNTAMYGTACTLLHVPMRNNGCYVKFIIVILAIM